jgi:GTP-binding protein
MEGPTRRGWGQEAVHRREETGDELADLGPGDSVVIARGGKGGFGNEHFKSAVNQTPRKATPGEEGEVFALKLELKVIAEVGLVGLPNAGKSTFLKTMTRADPKIANYPFTTLSPQLGIATLDQARRLVIADIPGLIEGASDGAGLGHDFLRHIERTKVIIHVLDVEPDNALSAAENYRAIRTELRGYSSELAEKPELIALNKLDLMTDEDQQQAMDEMRTELQLDAATEIYPISGATGDGCQTLLEAAYKLLHRDRDESGW